MSRTRNRSATPRMSSAGENPTLDVESGKIPLSRRKPGSEAEPTSSDAPRILDSPQISLKSMPTW
jgi:hypothetical protein